MNYKLFRKLNFLGINSFIIDLSSPLNISYFWNFGSLLGLMLLIQFLTGLFLSFHYSASVLMAYESVIHIVRDVNGGWLLRYMHINGASFFFIFLYFHVGRGLYYFSFKKTLVWLTGVIIFLLLMMIAFMGYILPWGQMSLWGATVITNLLSSIPVWGEMIVYWIWGGYSVGNPTLIRFFSFHFFFPFFMIFVIFLHLIFLHGTGSGNPLGLSGSYDKIYFYPYFLFKDFIGFFFFMFIYLSVVFFFPLILVDSENFIVANSMITPLHIQPEWYYLFSYAILRSVPNKLGGVISLFCSILILLILMFINSKFNSLKFYPFMDFTYFLFINNLFLLMWVGSCPIEYPFYGIGQLLGFFFFFFFFMYVYFVKFWDNLLN
uniref:Cytochrome b n=1 Tax=Aleyrodes shizuokensis TaxID=860392 RepID=A0A7T1K7L5_9HEMI|nr:cytochrome b [Aleyrodes shizuokensis]QPO06182.1 cytochrome b [Aleyrodes shizuokensis]